MIEDMFLLLTLKGLYVVIYALLWEKSYPTDIELPNILLIFSSLEISLLLISWTHLVHPVATTLQRNCLISIGKPFHYEDGLFYDEDCFRDVNSYKCGQCKQQIDGNDINFTVFQEKYCHHRCFTCSQCKQSLSMQKFKIFLGEKYCSRCR